MLQIKQTGNDKNLKLFLKTSLKKVIKRVIERNNSFKHCSTITS